MSQICFQVRRLIQGLGLIFCAQKWSHVCVCICVSICACVRIHVHMCAYASMCAYACICAQKWSYVCMCAHMWAHVCICVHRCAKIDEIHHRTGMHLDQDSNRYLISVDVCMLEHIQAGLMHRFIHAGTTLSSAFSAGSAASKYSLLCWDPKSSKTITFDN